ncbi:hypothetical protein ACIP9H_40435 [Streptomyces sp. NPDC088732]|uniref:hypothetical protein n=1 Tax=Streptomyces sp. NPDC088732 TaxID=3365879 RepID=UPI003823F23E
MPAYLDVLLIPPFSGDGERFALVLSGWDGPPLPDEYTQRIKEMTGAYAVLVFAHPVALGSPDVVMPEAAPHPLDQADGAITLNVHGAPDPTETARYIERAIGRRRGPGSADRS